MTQGIELIDSHVHWHFPDFDLDREAALGRARKAGVTAFINVGTDLKSSQVCLELARAHDFIFAAAGFHPHDAQAMTDLDFQGIAEILRDPKAVAIGEVGLDFYRNLSPRRVQEEVLERFIALHWKTGKPLILHTREAYAEMEALLRACRKGDYRGVMHCYSSDKAVMKKFLDLGFYISFAGPLTYRKNHTLREAVAACPLERLLLETDAPFLPPENFRGKRNESAYMIETARAAAQALGTRLEALSHATSANARTLFRL